MGQSGDDAAGQIDVAAYWDANAPQWADYVRRGWDSYREHFNTPAFLEFVGDVAGLELLDAGCGEGYNTRLLAQAGAAVTGVDISHEMIARARDAESQQPLGVGYEVAAFEDLSMLETASFDRVVSFMALMDGADLAGAMAELHRVLRPGGHLMFSILHPCFITPGVSWIRDDRGAEIALQVGDYFADEPFIERWTFSKAPLPADAPPFVVPRFPRTLSKWLNTLVQTGFAVSRVDEPRPTGDAAACHPWLARWRRHAVLLLYVDAAKTT